VAAGLVLVRLRTDGWIEDLGPELRLEIAVREPSTSLTNSCIAGRTA
jgi:hypothetical protein